MAIVNDRIDVALAAGADGVHVGQVGGNHDVVFLAFVYLLAAACAFSSVIPIDWKTVTLGRR